ncbi:MULTISPECIES: HAD family hydrolase [Acidiphilium]|uniref:capsular biosynthesis protein n=1 Tax=Acidiphilium TaxID=522 RepID=UPI0004944740|nr:MULTISPECIES: capsular biosynthesis protein [Acidiphilium]
MNTKRIVIDLDNTLTLGDSTLSYSEQAPNHDVIDTVRNYKKLGFDIIIYTSRNMRTYDNSVGKINAHTLPLIIGWLKQHDIPYDEVHVGKPWCGFHGFYVDDRAIRPSEFVSLSIDEIQILIGNKK